MKRMIDRRSILRAGGAGLLASSAGLPRPAIAAGKTYRIALSNSFIGNKWRLEMENVFKAALQMEPYKSEVEGTWFNSGNDVSKQSQQLSNLISAAGRCHHHRCRLADRAERHPPPGGRARHPGRLVRQHRSPSRQGLKVNTDQFNFGETWAEWLAKKLNGKGNVIMVTGVAGTSIDQDRNKGADSVWAKNPGHQGGHPLHRHVGLGRRRPTPPAMLPTRCRKIDGIWCQGGTDGVLKAFVAANRSRCRRPPARPRTASASS